MLDIPKLYKKYNIPVKGVIHIGAHEGGELKAYRQIGVPKVLFIEANPKVYSVLQQNMYCENDVKTICAAISNRTGTCNLHVTSMDQSSSILPLKHHLVVYPDIVETECIKVPCFTLDDLFDTLEDYPHDFNFINIDIQGAELMAFQGAGDFLENHIEAINTEVNYKEMYEGCALKNDIDFFLKQFGFDCKETIMPDPT